MNITTYLKKCIFYIYMAYVIFMYTKPITIELYLEDISRLNLDKVVHFFTFLLLGLLAQNINNKENKYTYGITLALILSLFIEFIHFVTPYRDFEFLDGLLNILGCIVGIVIVHLYRKKL